MLEVYRTKIDNDSNIYNYYFKDDKDQIGVVFCGDNDLYFCTFNRDKKSEFYITKENMTIYNLFCDLFNSFKNPNIFKSLQCSEGAEIYENIKEKNKKLKETKEFKSLFNNNRITWISDNSISFDYNSADSFSLIKYEYYFKFEFTFYEDIYPHFRSIRIRNSRSRYKPFNMLFMDFYNKLQEYDPNYHQIHMEEYLFNREQPKKLIKK